MSLSRFGLVALVAALTMISTDRSAIAAQHDQTQIRAETATAPSTAALTRPAPCCGTITGDS